LLITFAERNFKEVSKLVQKLKSTLACVAAVFFMGLPSLAGAGTIYYTSLNSGDSTFAKYDTNTNSWTSLNPHFIQSGLAVSSTGDVFNYNAQTNQIEQYNPNSDTWTNIAAGPGLSSQYGNMEIDNNGRFLLTGTSNSNLYYSDGGGSWNTQALGFTANAMGDYDPTTGQYVLGIQGQKDIVLIDTTTFAQTGFISAGAGSEWRRSGAILDNIVYEQTSSSALTLWDLTNPAAAPTTLAGPSGLNWASTAADRDNSIMYMTSLFNGRLWQLDGGIFTELASGPGVQNHSSIVYVADNAPVEVSEPGIWLLFGIGLAGLGYARRKRAA
jgi:hypothetical protein